MLDEIIPAVKSLQKSKLLAAEPAITNLLPLVSNRISFLPFIDYLKARRPAVSETTERLYSYLIKKFENEPSLLHVDDVEIIHQHADLMELLTTSLFPVVANDHRHIFALAAPYQFSVFYYSDHFREIFFDSEEKHLLLPDGIPIDELKAIQCATVYDHVLRKFYGIKLNDDRELVYPITDPNTGMLRYYKIKYDSRFIDLKLKGQLPAIKDCAVCLNSFRILDLEKQLVTMPLELFEAEGFAVWVAEDVTTTESLEVIKKILLREDDCDTYVIDDLKKAVKGLIGLNDIQVGLMPFVKINDRFVLDEENAKYSLAAKQWLNGGLESLEYFKMYTAFLQEYPTPVPVSNLSEQMFDFAPFLRTLHVEGARSYITYPMQNSDGLLGLLEVSSTIQNSLTHEIIARLEPAIPLLSLALLKCRDSFQYKIEKVIKEKFTALQQPVEWKFAEVAWDYLRNNNNDDLTKNVVFENVYPLYGAIDIRNSSLERSHAIQKDLKEHLVLVSETLDRLYPLIQLPLLEGLKFKNENIRQSIQANMTAEDEIHVNEFLSQEAEPVFDHLQKNDSQASEIVAQYFNIVNDSNSSLYRYRHEYEQSVSKINDAILAYLAKEEEAIQKSYPHYFEKYRTDGIEYNIYIGQSISPQRPFNLLYLKNIRLWQLRSMAEAARITHQLVPSLKVPLQTTQLILVHSQSIAISFRREERKFDVEGSYNIRYEIIKKRLDKVRIKDTGERLTQPGKIAIVYFNQKEVPEYQEYIEFLKNKNIIKPGVEFLELEELQGVKGMRALRVEINLEG
ncbi:MAG TPA: hypothetical protein VGQ09_11265 [Chitinophagaceae bacterium]|jgi:hypothetical protein|nr:hypothetical protein [Chitinophagaceae bacterium]